MEKKEIKIKCSGCGTHYKLRIPVTEKPVSFKCKKCEKILRIKLKAPQDEPIKPKEAPLAFETTQLPDVDDYQDQSSSEGRDPVIEDHVFGRAPLEESRTIGEQSRRWIVLAGDIVKGPFSDGEIITMIEGGEISQDTSIRMGERPWVRAEEVAAFKAYFPGSVLREPDEKPIESSSRQEKIRDLKEILPYPFTGSNLIPFLIFAGTSILLSIAFAFDFFIGLALNIVFWSILYGYLRGIADEAVNSPTPIAPAWDFSQIKDWLTNGGKLMLVLFVFSLIPVGILILLMIALLVNDQSLIGYILIAIIPFVFAGTTYILPAAFMELRRNGIGAALNPAKWLSVVKRENYKSVGLTSVVIGMAIFLVVLSTIFITDLPLGFLFAGILMGFMLAYGHFIWFYVLGRWMGDSGDSRVQSPA